MSKNLIKWSELNRKLSGSDNSIRPNYHIHKSKMAHKEINTKKNKWWYFFN